MKLIKKLDRRPVGTGIQKTRYAEFECESCNDIVVIPYNRGRDQATCGCATEYHNESNTHLYNVWSGIKRRCYNPKQKSYIYYGAVGVEMCDEWINSYLSFKEWALSNGWEKGLEVSRDGDKGNYAPSNCSIKTKLENAREAHLGKVVTEDSRWKIIYTVTGLNEDDFSDMIEMATSGEFKNVEIANGFGIERHVVTRAVERCGHTPKYRKGLFTSFELGRIRSERDNYTIKELASKYNSNHETIGSIVNRRGIYAN